MRRSKAGPWFRLVATVLRPLLVLLTKRDWRGAEHLRAQHGGVIVAANHLSWVDPVTFGHYVLDAGGRPPRFLAKAELFKILIVGRVIRGAGQIPVYRGTKDASLSLRDAVAALKAGGCVVIYPEGTCTRDPDYWPMAGKTGVARLALATGAPVIPVAQWGPQEILPYRAKRLHLLPRKTVHVLAGPPVDLSAYLGGPATPDVLRAVTDTIMRQVADLLGELRGEAPPATLLDGREASSSAIAEAPAVPELPADLEQQANLTLDGNSEPHQDPEPQQEHA